MKNTIDEMIAVLEAAKAGKTIQVRTIAEDKWIIATSPTWNFDAFEYRIKPEKKKRINKKYGYYRKYTIDEFAEEWKKHSGFIRYNNPQPLKYGILVLSYDENGVRTIDGKTLYLDLCSNFVWSDDGTPCGKYEEIKIEL